MTIYEMIGEELRMLRLKNHMSQGEVAQRTGYLSRNSISLIEKGGTKIDLEALEKICNVFGVDWVDLLEKVQHERTQGRKT